MASAEVDREKLATLRVRELALETQVNKLQEDLHDAKKCHTPVNITTFTPVQLPVLYNHQSCITTFTFV